MPKPTRPPLKKAGGNGSPETPAATSPDHADIARLAYLHWLDRGCPLGSPEQDWTHAEKELKTAHTRTT